MKLGYFLFGYLFAVFSFLISALMDWLTAKFDNKMLFRKIFKSILKGVEKNA